MTEFPGVAIVFKKTFKKEADTVDTSKDKPIIGRKAVDRQVQWLPVIRGVNFYGRTFQTFRSVIGKKLDQFARLFAGAGHHNSLFQQRLFGFEISPKPFQSFP